MTGFFQRQRKNYSFLIHGVVDTHSSSTKYSKPQEQEKHSLRGHIKLKKMLKLKVVAARLALYLEHYSSLQE